MITIGEASLLISFAGAVVYARKIVSGKVRPERVTWFVWTVILGLALWGYHASGGNDSTWFLVGDFVVTLTIFLLSIWRGKGGFNRFDLICLFIAILGLVVSQISHTPMYVVCGAIVADSMALIPTIKKALQEPETEDASTFSFTSVAAAMGIVAVGRWSLLLLFYPVYLFLANFVTAIVILVSQYQSRRILQPVIKTKIAEPQNKHKQRRMKEIPRSVFISVA